jgi:circadian clock protein KaiC
LPNGSAVHIPSFKEQYREMTTASEVSADLASTGIEGLDDVLRGGLPRNRLYLIQGDPGSGKTTMGLQFLLEGQRRGEVGMYISLSETREEIVAVAQSHGWDLDGVHLLETTAAEQQLSLEDENTLFEPSEVELRELMERLLSHIEKAGPSRVVLDSLSEMRLVSQTGLRYRRQVLTLKQFFAGRKCTVLLLDDRTTADDDRQLQSLAHGVLSLESRILEYGNERRRVRVVKLRGVQPRGGYHELAIVTGGLRVFPRLVAAEHHPDIERGAMDTGVSELDKLLGGGIDRATATLIMGPAGSGKSTLALRLAMAALDRGEQVALFAFDERVDTMLARLDGLGIDLRTHLQSGLATLRQIDPAEMGPGEFTAVVRASVEAGARLVIIDSLNGYLNAMPEERLLALQLHELLSYLGHLGVTSIMVMAQHGLTGQLVTPVDVSYIADTVILLRFFEVDGKVRKAISVVKKRSGAHEETIREYSLGAPYGLRIGPPLTGFRGVLTGAPLFEGVASKLFDGSTDGGSRP